MARKYYDDEEERRAAEDAAYVSPWASGLAAAERAVTERAPFSYDNQTDPAYQSYKKAYIREGRRAAEDTLARAASLTGGVPSSWAQTAAQQAENYYAAQLSDRIPELWRLAYDMYGDEVDRAQKTLAALRALDGDSYGRWRDSVEDAYRERAYADERADADYARRWSEAAAAAKLGDWSGYEALGVDTSERGGKRYAYSADGGVYEIGSRKGLAFLSDAQPGQTMAGGDGSVWTKSPDGAVTITRGGQTWTVAAPAESAKRSAAYAAPAKAEAEPEAEAPAAAAQRPELDLPRYTPQSMSAKYQTPASSAGPRAEKAGSLDDMPAGEGVGRGEYNLAGRGVIALWDAGEEARARQQLAALWPQLSAEQRESLRGVLALHGMRV